MMARRLVIAIVLLLGTVQLLQAAPRTAQCPNGQLPKKEANGRIQHCLPGQTSICGSGYFCFYNGFDYQCCPLAEKSSEEEPGRLVSATAAVECPAPALTVLDSDGIPLRCDGKVKKCPQKSMFCGDMGICCEDAGESASEFASRLQPIVDHDAEMEDETEIAQPYNNGNPLQFRPATIEPPTRRPLDSFSTRSITAKVRVEPSKESLDIVEEAKQQPVAEKEAPGIKVSLKSADINWTPDYHDYQQESTQPYQEGVTTEAAAEAVTNPPPPGAKSKLFKAKPIKDHEDDNITAALFPKVSGSAGENQGVLHKEEKAVKSEVKRLPSADGSANVVKPGSKKSTMTEGSTKLLSSFKKPADGTRKITVKARPRLAEGSSEVSSDAHVSLPKSSTKAKRIGGAKIADNSGKVTLRPAPKMSEGSTETIQVGDGSPHKVSKRPLPKMTEGSTEVFEPKPPAMTDGSTQVLEAAKSELADGSAEMLNFHDKRPEPKMTEHTAALGSITQMTEGSGKVSLPSLDSTSTSSAAVTKKPTVEVDKAKAGGAANVAAAVPITYSAHQAGGYAVERKVQASKSFIDDGNQRRAAAQAFLLQQIRDGWPYDERFYRPPEHRKAFAVVHFAPRPKQQP